MTSKSKDKISAADKMSTITKWISEGIPCDRIRLQTPVAPSKDKEPVGEFYIKGPTGKYLVEYITYTPHGVIWSSNGETQIVPLANVMNARFIL